LLSTCFINLRKLSHSFSAAFPQLFHSFSTAYQHKSLLVLMVPIPRTLWDPAK
jgi:hypothetical protein